MTVSAWLSLAAVCALGAMSPGPSLAVIIRQTLRHSRRHGFVAAVSHGVGVGLYAVLVLLGLGSLFAHLPGLAQGLTWLGAAYLAWLGVKALASAHQSSFEVDPAAGRAVPLTAAAREGFLVAFLNPKLAVFFMALFAQFIEPGQTLFDQGLMATTAWVIDSGWYLLVAVLLSQPRWLPWLHSHGAWIDRITGVLLIAIALRVLTL